MIVILHEPSGKIAGDTIATALRTTYPQITVELVDTTTAMKWPGDQSWEDLIIVPYDETGLSARGREFIERELAVRKNQLTILPVTAGKSQTPPAPIDGIKALPLEPAGGGRNGRLATRVGAILGLRLRQRDQTIFISYRLGDGTSLATQLEAYLVHHGYRVWRDESRDDFDNEPSILPGTKVQEAIYENLKTADLVLLLDTPRAAESKWIKIEVDLATGELIPVLPVLLRRPGERCAVSRFRLLSTLQRGCGFEEPPTGRTSFSDAEMDAILVEMETYLRDIFERRLRVPFLVEQEFARHKYKWSNRDRFIYEALREHAATLRVRVFSHCAYFDGVFDPALKAFVTHLESVTPRANFALYVYDGALIPPAQIEEINRAAALEDSTNIIVLHYQEVAALLHSNFTSRT